MKIFISHSSKDKDVFDRLVGYLKEDGHEVFDPYEDILAGDIWPVVLTINLNQAALLVAIITDNFLTSWCQAELSAAVFSDKEIRLLPVLVGNVFAPYYLQRYQCLKAENIQDVPDLVRSELRRSLYQTTDTSKLFSKGNKKKKEDDTDSKIDMLRKAFKENNLTLVCGAGVSIASHAPSWDELLNGLLNTRLSHTGGTRLLKVLPNSYIIMGKYLKNLLGNSFEESVRDQLYRDLPEDAINTPLLASISRLSQPNRHGVCLDSIITYNFDDLIEKKLDSLCISYTSIWKEKQNHKDNALPIYHVHGYLPQAGALDGPNLVLSEEAYHSQYIDPYCWSNLVQLNTFTSKVCLFVGSSLTDPNMRRLLDITYRKKNEHNHFIIMKMPMNQRTKDELAATLIEQDANSLGINVIWCSDYNDIPNILEKIIS